MKTLIQHNREIDETGEVFVNTEGIVDLLNNGSSLDGISFSSKEEQELFNNLCIDKDLPEVISKGVNHIQRIQNWNYPDEYKNIDIDSYFINLVNQKYPNDSIRLNRVKEELSEVKNKQISELVKWSIWFTDYMTENDLFWGLGRGSSCSVFLFYLIELHLIDPIESGLDYKEFFK